MIRNLGRLGAFAFVMGVVYGCGADNGIAPATPAAHRLAPLSETPGTIDRGDVGSSLQGGVPEKADTGIAPTSEVGYVDPGPDTVLVLKRTQALPNDLVASAVIGPAGGEIKIAQAGAKIDFPAGALSAPTRITMTAKAGWNVAYEFEPHGTQFAKPVKVQQNLKDTYASVLLKEGPLEAAYYSDLNNSFVDRWKLFAKVSDVRKVQSDDEEQHNPRSVKFYVFHFSGYLMSSGFKGGFGGGDEQR